MIHLTPVASSKVKEIMNMQSPVPVALRVAVVGGGCSGFQYHMAFENNTSDADQIFEFDGLKVAVDQMSSMYLDGIEIEIGRASCRERGEMTVVAGAVRIQSMEV